MQQWAGPAPDRAWDRSRETVKIFSSRHSSSSHLRTSAGPGKTGTAGREYSLSLERLLAEHKEIIGKLRTKNQTKTPSLDSLDSLDSQARQVSSELTSEQSAVTRDSQPTFAMHCIVLVLLADRINTQ